MKESLLWNGELHNLLDALSHYLYNIVENIEYDIDVETLFIKDYQMYILRGKGISKISNGNIYDIEKRNDIVVHLYLSWL